MGLDMWLFRVRYVKAWEHQPEHMRPVVTLTVGGRNVPLTRPAYIKDEVMYWRKENAIHNWFVKECAGGVDECQPIYVSDDKLAELRDVMKAVLDDPEAAKEKLPTASGFFFGGTEYDEWYYNGLRETVAKFNELLAEETDDEFEYQASW